MTSRTVSGAVITAIETVAVHPAVRPELVVAGARGTHDRSDFLLVRLSTSAGVQGLGEVSGTLIWSGEDATTAEHVIRVALAPAILGRPVAPVADLEHRMDQALAGHPFTKAGLSTAAWDAWSQLLEVPLVVALGGPMRSEVAIKCSLSGNGERLRTGWTAARASGFTAYKIKIGMDVDSDVERMRELRSWVGPETFVGLDANGGYHREDARRAGTALRELGAAFFEQPVAPDDLVGMHALRDLGMPVVADESVYSLADLRAVVQARAADAVSVYVGKSAGPGRAVELAAAATTAGLDVVLGSNGELGIGAAAQLHVACAIRGLSTTIPHDIIGAHYYTDDVLTDGPVSDGTRVRLADGPGLGVTLRDDVAAGFHDVLTDPGRPR